MQSFQDITIETYGVLTLDNPQIAKLPLVK
jgi:hypothetical protein